MIFFHSQRLRMILAVCLALVIAFTQGLRVQIHDHHDFALAHTGVHAHIVDAWESVDHLGNAATGDTEISKLTLIKLLAFKQLLAITTLFLLLLIPLRVCGFASLLFRRPYFSTPCYLSPPGHAPPL